MQAISGNTDRKTAENREYLECVIIKLLFWCQKRGVPKVEQREMIIKWEFSYLKINKKKLVKSIFQDGRFLPKNRLLRPRSFDQQSIKKIQMFWPSKTCHFSDCLKSDNFRPWLGHLLLIFQSQYLHKLHGIKCNCLEHMGNASNLWKWIQNSTNEGYSWWGG